MESSTRIFTRWKRKNITYNYKVNFFIIFFINKIRTLNKITPEKFAGLTKELSKLYSEINNEEVYKEAVSLLFAKAISEPSFSKLYATLCIKINEKTPNIPNQVNFLKIIIF